MNYLEFGAAGTLLKEAGTETGSFSAINALEDSTVTVITNWVNAGATETVALVAGQTVYGIFTSVAWVSGTVVAY